MATEKLPADKPHRKPEPEELCLKLILWIAQGSFECRTMLPERTYTRSLNTGKLIMRRTVKDVSLRSARVIGEKGSWLM